MPQKTISADVFQNLLILNDNNTSFAVPDVSHGACTAETLTTRKPQFTW